MQISIDGYISFGKGFSSSYGTLPLNSSTPLPLIAVYWIEEFFSNTKRNILHHRVSMDNFTLSEVVQVITDINYNLTEFKPTLAMITTWLIENSINKPVKMHYVM